MKLFSEWHTIEKTYEYDGDYQKELHSKKMTDDGYIILNEQLRKENCKTSINIKYNVGGERNE